MKGKLSAAVFVLLGFVAGWISHAWVSMRTPAIPEPLQVAPVIIVAPPPDPFQERDSMVVRIAREIGIDPILALAVAYVENPEADSTAVSRAGAVGLMQVMSPDALTARGNREAARHRTNLITRVCGSVDRLVERSCNIRVGLLIYRDYLIQYDGNERLALVAYNGALAYPRAAARYVAAVRSHVDRLNGTSN